MSVADTIKDVFGAAAVDRLREARDYGAALISPVRESMLRRKLAGRRLALSDLDRFKSGVTLFFAPAAGVVPHFVTHCIMARTLQELGHPVLLAGCFMAYPRCIAMEGSPTAARLTERHAGLVCVRCGNISADFTQAYGLDVLDIATLLQAEDWTRIEASVANAPEDLTQLMVDGVAFGKIASSAVSVSKKTLDFAGRDPVIRKAILDQVRGGLISYYAMANLIGKIPVSRLVYFSEYTIHLGAMAAAQRAGIPITNMTHASSMAVNRQRPALFGQPLAILTYREMLKQWPQWRHLPLSPARVDEMFNDILFRFTGDSAMVYSRKRSGDTNALFDQLRLTSDKPVLVAFTSSLDEIFANRLMLDAVNADPLQAEQPFADQIAWLSSLIARAEADRFQLIVRVHPREGGNRREPNSSEHLELLRRHFDRPYRNTRIIWPGDNVSSYDLMEIADAGTAAWSSTTIEMSRWGVPTVVTFHGYTPTPLGDVVDWNATEQGYLDLVEKALDAPASLERAIATMRWMHVKLFGHTIDLADVVPTPDYETLPPYRWPAAAGFVEDVLVKGTELLELNRQALEQSQHPLSAERERQAVLRNLRRAVWILSTGVDPGHDYTLTHGAPAGGTLPAGVDAAAWSENGHLMFQTRDGTTARRSRLVEQLVTMIAGET